MSDRVKYERLQDLKASISGRQGIFVYAPVAQQERLGIVKGSDSIIINEDGSIEIRDFAKTRNVQVLPSFPSDLTPYEGGIFIVDKVVYAVDNGVAQEAEIKLDTLIANTLSDPGNGSDIRLEEELITIDVLGVKHFFGYTEGTTFFPFHYKKSEVDALLATAKENIEDGTTVVGKALKDSLGNVIKSTYANKLDLAYSSSNNRIAITLKSPDDTSLDADLINLPKATDTNDGLLAKEDKAYVNGLPSALLLKENKSEKGIANGYASLDGGAKIHTSQLPDSILGQLEYKGTFNPSSGYPISPEKGWFYISIANATISGKDYKVGDWAVYNGSSWDKVDNTDAVASVNGKIGVVVLNGTEIQVGNGDTWTVEQRIVDIYAELNNRYTKTQTYSNTEIEQRLTDLLGMANLQDILIGSYTNGQTVLASDLSPYNFVIVLGKDVDNTYTGTFKPSEIVSGNIISLSPTVYLTRGATNFTITTPTSIKLWGIKLDGISADEVDYDNSTSGLEATNVQEAVNELDNVLNITTYEVKTEMINSWKQSNGNNYTSGTRVEEIIDHTKKYLITGTCVNSSFPLIVYENINGSVIGVEQNMNTRTIFVDYEANIPATAYKIYVNGYDEFVIDTTTPELSRIRPRVVKIIKTLDNIEQKLKTKMDKNRTHWIPVEPVNFENQLLVIRYGSIDSTAIAGYGRTYYNFDRSKKYRFSGIDYDIAIAYVYPIVGLDKDGGAIWYLKDSTNNSILSTNRHCFENYELDNNDIPKEVVQLVIGGEQNGTDYIRLQTLEQIDYGLPLGKKKIGVCFGDSITQGNGAYLNADFITPFSYPSRIGQLLDYEMYNAGLGGSMATATRTIDLSSVIDAILSGNYSNIYDGIETYGLNKTAIKNYNLIEQLDFNDVDFVTFCYGTNDWLGSAIEQITTALQTQINRLLTAYPHLKVYIITPIVRFELGTLAWGNDWTNSAGVTLPQLCDGIIEWAKSQNYPCKDAYHELGINLVNRHSLFESNDSDLTHPSKDGYGLLAEMIAKFINSK